MPAKSESQRKLFATALGQKRSGDITDTPAGKIAETVSEKKIKDFVTKEDNSLELDKDKPQVGVKMQDTKQHEMLNKTKTKEFNDYIKNNTCKKEEDEEEESEEGLQKGGPGSGRKPEFSEGLKHTSSAPYVKQTSKDRKKDEMLENFNPKRFNKPAVMGFPTNKSSDTDFSIEFLEKKIKELDNSEELTKGKVYVKPGDPVPEGRTLVTGSKGAKYYETSSDPNKGLPSDNPKEPGSHVLHDSYYASPTGPNPKGKTAHDVAKEIGAKFNRKVNSLTTEYAHPKYGIFRVTDDGWGTKLRHIGEGKSTDMKKSILDTPIQQAFNEYMNSFGGQESKDECIAFVNTSSPIVKITSTYDKTTDEVFPDSPGISDKNLQSGATKEGRENQPFDYSKKIYDNPESEKEKDKMELEKGGPGSGRKQGAYLHPEKGYEDQGSHFKGEFRTHSSPEGYPEKDYNKRKDENYKEWAKNIDEREGVKRPEGYQPKKFNKYGVNVKSEKLDAFSDYLGKTSKEYLCLF